MEKMREAEMHKRMVRNRATIALKGVENSIEKGGVMSGDAAKALRDTNRGGVKQRTRPSTAPRMRGTAVRRGHEQEEDIWNAPPKGQNAFDDDLMTVTSVNTKASSAITSGSVVMNEEDLDLNTPLEGMSEVELKEGLTQLRGEGGGMRSEAVWGARRYGKRGGICRLAPHADEWMRRLLLSTLFLPAFLVAHLFGHRRFRRK
jgi:hypothetical protein